LKLCPCTWCYVNLSNERTNIKEWKCNARSIDVDYIETYFRAFHNTVYISHTDIIWYKTNISFTSLKTFKLFGFQIFWLCAYLMMVIPETRRAQWCQFRMDILQNLVPTHYICNKFIENFNKMTILNNGSFGIHKYLENDYILFKTSNYVLDAIVLECAKVRLNIINVNRASVPFSFFYISSFIWQINVTSR
jgi:hypothetical protein